MQTNPDISPLVLDLAGVFVFALSGGLVAVRKRFDLFGAQRAGLLTVASVWAAALLVFGIRMVAVVLHLNAPQPFRLGDRT